MVFPEYYHHVLRPIVLQTTSFLDLTHVESRGLLERYLLYYLLVGWNRHSLGPVQEGSESGDVEDREMSNALRSGIT